MMTVLVFQIYSTFMDFCCCISYCYSIRPTLSQSSIVVALLFFVFKLLHTHFSLDIFFVWLMVVLLHRASKFLVMDFSSKAVVFVGFSFLLHLPLRFLCLKLLCVWRVAFYSLFFFFWYLKSLKLSRKILSFHQSNCCSSVISWRAVVSFELAKFGKLLISVYQRLANHKDVVLRGKKNKIFFS